MMNDEQNPVEQEVTTPEAPVTPEGETPEEEGTMETPVVEVAAE